MNLERRKILTMLVAIPAHSFATVGLAQSRTVWSVKQAQSALLEDRLRLLDIRTREEWRETGVALGAWPISMREPRFQERLFTAQQLSEGRETGLICATGGRSGAVSRALKHAKYSGFVDVSEGMLGSSVGVGWIASGLPIVPMEEALASLPAELL